MNRKVQQTETLVVGDAATAPLPISAPIVHELTPAPDPWDAFLRFSDLPNCLFFDTVEPIENVGRYSFLMADPFAMLRHGPEEQDSLGTLSAAMQNVPARPVDGLPPFQGGAAGLFGYELARQLETIPAASMDEFRVPVMAVGMYDVVVSFDHQSERAWLISHGFPEQDAEHRRRRAEQRLDEFRTRLESGNGSARRPTAAVSNDQVAANQLSPQHDVTHPGVTSNFSRGDYLETVRRAIEYVHAGDVFQVNLAQRLLAPATTDSISLYARLREANPSPFAAYFDVGDFQILSSSPERFLRVVDGEVETRPIKGTRRRVRRAEADLFAGDELQASDKDRAENVMIVDLLRNDLSRVCTPDSVQVSELCRLEHFRFVQHLVSVIHGRLAPHHDALDLLRAAFPGGSITGAPKVRAMEIIAELEPNTRGAYCGSLGYVGFDGSMDSNILIRSVTAGRGWWQAHVGGGIVAESQPEAEYEETWHKAEGLLRAMSP